ncbi:MAG TPA: 2Fe-2S iron-sulfur cluster-binding protein [Thermoplasmata archaeon]|nr:2Fe-2S iron-sulfur cluster-binding protein [Thermoplasmata archaeon]
MADPRSTRFTFGRNARFARPGDTLLAALSEDGLPTLQRSIRYHRPRAPFCGVGFCTQCLVRVNGVPNVRACTYVPRSGDRVVTENAWPSPRHDLLGALDVLFAQGIDTLRGFRRPRWAMPLYHRVVRRLAGYGELPDATARPIPPAQKVRTDVVVVGAGPAGRAAAQRLTEQGLHPLLLDRGPVTAPPEGVDVRPGVTAVFLPPPSPLDGRFELLADGWSGALSVSAARVLVATGAYDANLLFAGNDRPGVMTFEGALAARDLRGDPPFRRALVVGGGARAAEVVERFGLHIAAVTAPTSVDGRIAESAAELEIAVHPRTLLVATHGRSRVRGAVLRRRGGGERVRLSVDAVVIAVRRLPHVQLFFQAGAKMHWRGAVGAYYPVLRPDLATTVPGLFAAGESAGFADPVAAEASGVAAAEAVLGREARLSDLPARVAEAGPSEIEGYYRELLGVPREGGKSVACPCEDVLLEELHGAHERGYRDIEVIKRYTSLGTGLCQGRYCVPEALLLLGLWESRSPSEVGYITQRPPVVPTSLGALASVEEPVASGGP